MKTIKTLILTTMLAPLLIISCSKDDDSSSSSNNTPAPTKSENMVGTWITTAITVDPPLEVNGTQITDYFAQLDPCTQDDIASFNADKSYTFEEGASKCEPTAMQIIDAGTWSFNTDETILILNSSGDISEFNLVSLSASTCVISFTEDDNGVKIKFTQTLNKQ